MITPSDEQIKARVNQAAAIAEMTRDPFSVNCLAILGFTKSDTPKKMAKALRMNNLTDSQKIEKALVVYKKSQGKITAAPVGAER